ncbi:uracil-xanthine permease family protein [Methanobacterium formicicum]|uniref:Xanthine/uracil/vitamin C permease n=1 Tax=Methanobacterium formicicum (strain DSM 3637 / PP1) TaxID=1204725 RepID=K2RCW2_METFP|nr:purine/pyrimidine permease [Methanobacterium formicicum]EKF86174.1 xanthine/uracil/vitamin C permease [Methanobacterium formicicum DSM 3637]
MRYGLDDKPKLSDMIIFGLQWLAVTIPFILIMGKVVGVMDGDYISYIQKLFLVLGFLILLQIFRGHKLPLIMGPAAVILVAILTSSHQGMGAINSSVLIGGLVLAILAASGLFNYLKKLFTPRVIIVILMLISFTLLPTIISLISVSGPVTAIDNFLFSLGFVVVLLAAHALLKGIWKSTLTLSALFIGTLVYYLIFGFTGFTDMNLARVGLPHSLTGSLAVPDVGVLAAFLVSFFALAVNDLASIESVGTILNADEMEKRVKNGITITGLGNVFSGIMGVMGSVNYSISPGLIAATGVASRYTFIPAAIGLIILSLSPMAIGIMSSIPSPVIGVIFLYILTAQIGASLLLVVEKDGIKTVDHGMIIGLPLILGTAIAFLPSEVASQLPAILRPVLGNGFVMGTLFVLFLEHLLYSKGTISRKNNYKKE